MKQLKFFLFLTVLFFSGSVFALRCGHALVNIGDHMATVYEKCGEPYSIETHIERRAVVNHANVNSYQSYGNRGQRFQTNNFNFGNSNITEVEVEVEEWLYNFGKRRFRQALRFENGRLEHIDNIGRN